MTPRIHRRGVLKGLGLGALAATVPMLRNARVFSQSNEIPKRILFFYALTGNLAAHPHETRRVVGHWEPLAPQGMSEPTETQWELNTMMEPLAAYKQDMILFENLDMVSRFMDQPAAASAHFAGATIALTGSNRFNAEQPGAISIDQLIAQRINSPSPLTRLPSFEVFGSHFEANPIETPSAIGPGMQVPVLWNPHDAYARAFPEPIDQSGMMEAMQRAAQRDRVFEFVLGRHAALRDRLGPEDRMKIQQHLDTVADLQRRLALTRRDVVVPPPSVLDIWDEDTIRGRADDTPEATMRFNMNIDLNSEIVAAALHADVTRVAMMQVVDPPADAFGYTPGQYGAEGPHDLQHKANEEGAPQYTDPDARATLQRAHLFIMNKFKNLLDSLAQRTESDGSRLLDHTIVVYCSEIGNGSHDLTRLPWIVVGSGGGYFQTGRYLRFARGSRPFVPSYTDAGRPHNDLFVTLANAMGVDIDTFGDPDVCTGPITEMRG